MLRFCDFFPKKAVKILLPLAFVAAVVSLFPARPLWQIAGLDARLPTGVQVEAISGSIWQGESLVSVRHQGLLLELKADWQLGLGSLWQQGTLLTVNLIHPGSRLQLALSPGWDLNQLNGRVSGTLHPLLLNPLLKQNKAWISGEIQINNLRWQLDGQRLSALDGAVIWQGGDTYFINPAQPQRPQHIPYPQLALSAKTSADSGEIRAAAMALGSSDPIATITLQPDGWLEAIVFGRIKQVVPELPVPRKAPEQALVKYKEKVF